LLRLRLCRILGDILGGERRQLAVGVEDVLVHQRKHAYYHQYARLQGGLGGGHGGGHGGGLGGGLGSK
jgi:hypothetical protein